jgi:hypothetical protein
MILHANKVSKAFHWVGSLWSNESPSPWYWGLCWSAQTKSKWHSSSENHQWWTSGSTKSKWFSLDEHSATYGTVREAKAHLQLQLSYTLKHSRITDGNKENVRNTPPSLETCRPCSTRLQDVSSSSWLEIYIVPPQTACSTRRWRFRWRLHLPAAYSLATLQTIMEVEESVIDVDPTPPSKECKQWPLLPEQHKCQQEEQGMRPSPLYQTTQQS